MKYELGQLIYYFDEAFCSAPVLSATEVKNAHEDWAHTKEQKEIFTPFGKAGIYYATCHGTYREEEVFPSKEELIKYLSQK